MTWLKRFVPVTKIDILQPLFDIWLQVYGADADDIPDFTVLMCQKFAEALPIRNFLIVPSESRSVLSTVIPGSHNQRNQ